MRLPTEWLREFLDIPEKPDRLAQELTQIGLEVENHYVPAQNLRKLLTVSIESFQTHPNNDQLSICEIYDGSSVNQIVTAAKNLSESGIYIWAPPGSAVVNKQIETSKLHGIESEGMLCSLEELGLATNSTNLLVLNDSLDLGKEVTQALGLEQAILEIDLTPNRSDCLSMCGIARDYGAFTDQCPDLPSTGEIDAEDKGTFKININNSERCHRYFGLEIENLDASASRIEIQRRLVMMGHRPKNRIVDATNYVLFEQGNPLHAFDASKLSGNIIVRNSENNETIETIDGNEFELSNDDLVIADQDQPRALAGVMGGAHSAVDNNTDTIFLEGAYFSPEGIRRSANRHKIHTDSSHRFERGVDPENIFNAMKRCLELLETKSTSKPVPKKPIKAIARKYQSVNIAFEPDKFESRIGFQISNSNMEENLKSLGCEVDRSDQTWSINIPSWRHDLTREEDLLEELLRLSGYNKTPSEYPTYSVNNSPKPNSSVEKKLRQLLSNKGFHEAVTFSFHSENNSLSNNGASFHRIKNPLSEEHEILRKNILTSLLPVFERNIGAGRESLELFEIGRVFPEGSTEEPSRLGMLLTGRTLTEKWDDRAQQFDFYDTKGVIESLFLNTGFVNLDFQPSKHQFFVEARTAELTILDCSIGHLGQIKPSLTSTETNNSIWGAELKLNKLPEISQTQYEQFSREPFVKRDLDLVVDRDLYARELRHTIMDTGQWLERLEIFDLYRGEPLPDDKKSLSFRLYFRAPDQTLNDDLVNEIQEKILNKLRDKYGANLRDE